MNCQLHLYLIISSCICSQKFGLTSDKMVLLCVSFIVLIFNDKIKNLNFLSDSYIRTRKVTILYIYIQTRIFCGIKCYVKMTLTLVRSEQVHSHELSSVELFFCHFMRENQVTLSLDSIFIAQQLINNKLLHTEVFSYQLGFMVLGSLFFPYY